MLHLLPTLVGPALAAGLPQVLARDVVQLRVEDLSGLLAHPKDAGLARAIALLDDRLVELPEELPGATALDAALVTLACELLAGPKTLRLGLSEGARVDAPTPPIYAQLALHHPSPDAARALEARVLGVLQRLGAPELPAEASGLRRLPDLPLPTRFGVAGSDVVLDLGAPPARGHAAPDVWLPAGATPRFALAVDCAPLTALLLASVSQSDPVAAELLPRLVARLGLDRLRLESSGAADGAVAATVTRIPGYAATMRANGLATKELLTAADLALVPRDATWASVGKVSFVGILDLVVALAGEALAAQGMEGDPLESLAAMTGFHLRDDLFGALGETVGLYASDTTGGGGLMSTVLFIAVRDPERAFETRERFAELIDSLGALELQGYVQVRTYEAEGHELATLTFPGLPVPLEPTVAITEQWLVVGASPTAARAALRQAGATGAPNLLDAPALAAQLAGGLAGLHALSFQDTERLVRDGYGLMQMAASALGNAVRSRTNGLREAGDVLPPFGELVQGVRAGVSVTRIIGDDLVVEGRRDASLAVRATAFCGWLGSSGLLVALPALAAIGATEQPGVAVRGF